MKFAIGIDLGGTNIKAVAISEAGEVLTKAGRQTRDEATNQVVGSDGRLVPVWAAEVNELVTFLHTKLNSRASFTGLCAPGLASKSGRSIAFMPGRMDGLENFDWTNFLQLGQPVHVLNDAHAALLGEVWQGAAIDCSNVLLLTLGTGVGGAVYADGRLLKGQIGRAGHLGHTAIQVDRPQDSVGIPGSLEMSICEGTVSRRSNGKFSNTKDLVEAALRGDEFARMVWERSVYELSCGVASLINAFDPEIVVIGGGIAKAGTALFEPIAKYLDRLEWRPNGHRVPILPAALGEWAGAIGAAYNAVQHKNSTTFAAIEAAQPATIETAQSSSTQASL